MATNRARRKPRIDRSTARGRAARRTAVLNGLASHVNQILSTPLKMTTSSQELAAHTHERIKPFIQRDLNEHSHTVDLYLWLEAVLDLDKKTLEVWVKKAKHHGWFEDSDIQAQLYAFCNATHETERYEPFCKIANKVLELAKGTILSKRAKYPIEDFTFVRNDPWYFVTNALHGVNGAKRKPDVVGVRRDQVARLQRSASGDPPVGLEWTSLLYFVEFKEHRKKIKAYSRHIEPPERPTPVTKPKTGRSSVRQAKVRR